MNASTFDFGSMTTEELIRMAQKLAYELWVRSGPVKTVITAAIKVVRGWFF